jgi:enamine deaminase RidA (YjgF/YER057c/UK114 family)
MEHPIEQKLRQLGIRLPAAPSPAANYLPYVVTGNLLFIAGQAAVVDGKLAYTGRLGAELGLADGQAAARISAINLLAQVKAACGGDWSRLARCVRICGYINAAAEFADHPQVLDGASDLLVEVLGEAGKHARSVLGASSLRSHSALVVDAVFELKS